MSTRPGVPGMLVKYMKQSRSASKRAHTMGTLHPEQLSVNFAGW